MSIKNLSNLILVTVLSIALFQCQWILGQSIGGITPTVVVIVDQSSTTIKQATNEPRGDNTISARFTISGIINLGLTYEAKYEYKPQNCRWSWKVGKNQNISNAPPNYPPPRITPPHGNGRTASLFLSSLYNGTWEIEIEMTAKYDIVDLNSNRVIARNLEKTGKGIFTVTITDDTIRVIVEPKDNFRGRSLKKLGIGETGTLSIIASDSSNPVSATFALNTHGHSDVLILENIDEDAGTAQFRAGSNDGNVTLTVTSKATNKTINYDLTVVKPESIVFEYLERIFEAAMPLQRPESNSKLLILQYKYGFTVKCYIAPFDVSFSSLKIKEDTAPCTSSDNLKYWRSPHKALPFYLDVMSGSLINGCRIMKDNNTNTYKFDIVYYTLPVYFKNAWIAWEKIPWIYKVKQTGGVITVDGTVKNVVEQRADVKNSITTVRKGNLISPPLDVKKDATLK
jgi:hypothetical protein